MKRLLFTFLFLAASVGMSYALDPRTGDTWDDNTKTLTVNADPGKNGYKNNTEIEHVVITDGVTSLANGAFYGCTSLTSVTLPSGLTTIGTDAFRETSLASVSLPSGLISIGSNAFNQCTALASVTFPEGLATIDVGAFSGCSSLTSVTLPESLTTINVGVFSGCTSLASVTIFAPSLYTYGKSVFYDTASGLKIYVPAGSVDTYKTNWSAYEAKIVAIGSDEPATTVTWDNTNVFTEANQNEIVGAADGWKTKTKATFEGVTISFDGTTESSSKFMCFDAGENDLKPRFTIYGNEGDSFTFTAPEGKKFSKIEIIDNGETFFTPYGDWTKPEDKKVVWNGTPANAVTLGGTGITNFDHLNSIVFTLAPAAPANSCGGGLTWELNNGELVISYDGEGTGVMNDYDIPNDNPAPWYANRENITSVSLPEGIKTIGKDAFRNCVNLTTVTIPNSVTTIGESAFVSVEHLETVTIGTGITSIVNGAFYGNAELTTVTCSATTPPSIGEMVFGSCSNLEHIYVPAESVDAYKTAWSAYASLISAAGGGSTDVIPCTAQDLGKVLCTDGSIYATVSDATAASKTAVAMIAYVDTENGKALALALADDGGEMLWETAKTTAAAHSPAVSGGTWTLASKDDWNNMITVAGSYTALRDGFSAVGGTNMNEDKYWSSTPENAYAWCYYFNYGRWVDGYVDNPCRVRACLAFDIPATPAYEKVMNLINEIPNPVVLTAECKAKIDAARAAFDALSDGDKDLVTNIATLTTAEAAFEKVMNIWLSGDCDVILWKDTTLTVRKHAGEGNGAMADYNYMSRAPWYSAHWYDPQPSDIVIKSVTIEEGVTHLGDYAFAWMSEMKTVSIPSSVTTIPEDAFYWSKAVDDIYFTADPSNLTWALPHSADGHFKENKATICHVPVDMLVAYQDKFTEINVTFVGDLDPITPLTPEQQQALDAVKGLINAIPSPVVYTEACEDAIAEAGAAYDALDDELKPFVVNYAVLTAAEATYENLKHAVVVEAKINAIPQPVTLKLATRDSIESARAAFDALTADQKAMVSNYAVLTDAEATMATLNPGGGAPAGALSGKFSVNADGDQISFAKGNLQATTEDLGEHWTWGFAANQWNYLGIAVANSKINGNGTVSENGTVDLFGWSTAATYYGINNSYKAVDYIGDFVDWGPNMGAGWRTLTKDEWSYLLQHSSNGKATVNDKNGYIFLPDNWSGPAFTSDPDNFTTNVYSGDDWTAMENAGAVFLPSGPARNGTSALIAMDAKYCSSTSLNNDTSYVFTIYYNQSQSACTGTNRAYGCMVRLVAEGGGATPLDSAQAVKDLIEAIPAEITLDAACVNAIDDARAAYDALSEAAQGALDDATVAKLTAAEDALALLKADHDAANAVIAKINAIGDVEYTTESKALIDAAREAYDALTKGQQDLVTNSATLTSAESTYTNLKAAADLTAAAYDLNTLIESAQEAYESVATLPKYASIAEQLLDAINTAKGIAENSEATLSELQTAKTNLQNAYDKFNDDMSGTVTNVDKVNTDASESDVWFDLSGRRLQGKPTTPGLYINNGRKAIVK